MTNRVIAPGFELLQDRAGYRLRYLLPQALAGEMAIDLYCRGPLLDGTRGIPWEIARRLAPVTGDMDLVAPWQVHGTAVTDARRIWAIPQRVKADGVHLDAAFSKNVAASLRFGDCTPVVLASDAPRPWATLLHSGFHGTSKDIFSAAWRGVARRYGRTALQPERVHVWIGPAIGACCYTRRFEDPSVQRALRTWQRDHYRVLGEEVEFDLVSQIAAQASLAGIPAENVFRLDLCTRCNADKFYSYRAGDAEDRMFLLAQIGGPQNALQM